MADVTVSGKQIQFVLSLGKNGVESETRTFTIDVPAGTTETLAKQRATAFITTYYGTSGSAAGQFSAPSLLQRNGWRDSDDGEDALDCLGIKATFIDETKTYFDIT